MTTALTPEQKYLDAVEKLNTLAKLIAEREAEREAKLRESECDKIMAMSEAQITALTRMQGSNPDDVAKLGRMACDLALKDVAIQRLEAELAAAKNTSVPSAAILLAEQVLHMDFISGRGLRARDLARQVLGNNHDVHEGECADVLRSLASSLSAGGYNATVVDPAVFKEKILWGIAQIEAELAACKKDAERWREWEKGNGLNFSVPTPTNKKPGAKILVFYSKRLEPFYSISMRNAIDAVIVAKEN